MKRREMLKLAGAAMVSPVLVKTIDRSKLGNVMIDISKVRINPAGAIGLVLQEAGLWKDCDLGSWYQAWNWWQDQCIFVSQPVFDGATSAADLLGVITDQTGAYIWLWGGRIYLAVNNEQMRKLQQSFAPLADHVLIPEKKWQTATKKP